MFVYPIYIKLEATNSWYKITNDHSFTEVKTLGKYYSISDFSDDILPMRNHLLDLIASEGSTEVTEEEYIAHLSVLEASKELKEF